MKLEDFRHKSASWWSDMMTSVAFADKNDPFGVRLEMPSDCSPPEVNLFIMTKDSDTRWNSYVDTCPLLSIFIHRQQPHLQRPQVSRIRCITCPIVETRISVIQMSSDLSLQLPRFPVPG